MIHRARRKYRTIGPAMAAATKIQTIVNISAGTQSVEVGIGTAGFWARSCGFQNAMPR
jgi:hypothetical protein